MQNALGIQIRDAGRREPFAKLRVLLRLGFGDSKIPNWRWNSRKDCRTNGTKRVRLSRKTQPLTARSYDFGAHRAASNERRRLKLGPPHVTESSGLVNSPNRAGTAYPGIDFMGMDLRPHLVKDAPPLRYNWTGWATLKRLLLKWDFNVGAYVTLADSNDGDLIPPQACCLIASAIAENYLSLNDDERLWLGPHVSEWLRMARLGGAEQW